MAITVAMRTQVAQLYVSLFGRAPDGEGLGYWVGQLDAGKTVAQVAQDMYNVPAARAYYPAFATNEEIVATFYQNVLGRAVGNDTEGQAFWVAKMNAAGATKGTVISEMLNVVANYAGTDAAGVASKNLFNNKTSVAQYYGEQNGTIAGATNALAGVTSDVATVATAKAAALSVASAGSTFTLTTGVDSISGTAANDTATVVIGTGATLNAGDTIALGQGTDTVRVSYGSNVALSTALSAATISGVETIALINPGVADNSVNVGGVTGLKTLIIEDAAALNSTTAATSITTPVGGVNVSLATAAGATTVGPVIWAANAADTALNLTLNGYVGTGAATDLTVTGAAATTLNVVTATAANKAAVFTAPATVTTLNIAAGTALTDTSTTAVAATKVNISGAGNVTLGATNFAATVTIDASGSTGNNSVTTEATTTLTYKGGSGNDTLIFAAGELTSADSIDLGAGSNTLSLADTALGGAGTKALNDVVNGITSAQTILVTGAATVDMSGVTARILSLGATSDFVVTKVEAADKLQVNAVTAGTLNATAGLGYNTLNLELNGSATAVAAVGATNVTNQANINIVSATTAATSFGANTIAAVTNSANATFVVTGANNLTVTSLSAAASFDASAATGVITVTGGNGASILKGGSKADVLTGATVAGGDTLIGGAGNDTINTGAVTGTVATVITGGTGADAINLKGVSVDPGRLVTLNTTAAESFATAAQFDTVTFSDQGTLGTTIVTVVTGLLSSVLVGATSVTLGTTTITAGGFLAVGSASATLTTTNQNFAVYQDSNSNGIIEASDLRIDFTDVAALDTMAVTLVGSQLVVTSTGV